MIRRAVTRPAGPAPGHRRRYLALLAERGMSPARAAELHARLTRIGRVAKADGWSLRKLLRQADVAARGAGGAR